MNYKSSEHSEDSKLPLFISYQWTQMGSPRQISRFARDLLGTGFSPVHVFVSYQWTQMGSNHRPPDYESGALTS